MIVVAPGSRLAELVPGEPDEVEQLATRLTRFAGGAEEASSRLDALDTGAWSGEAGALFLQAAGELPTRLACAAAAFAIAARELRAYAAVLREAQATAARAVRLVEQSTAESGATDRQTASVWVARVRAEVEQAGEVAAARLARAGAADLAKASARALPGGVSVRLVSDYRLADPEAFVSPLADWGGSVADVCFTEPHPVGFDGPAEAAGPTPVEPAGAWAAWAGSGERRELGAVETGVLAGLGLAAVGLTVVGRRRRESTALDLVGLDESELRRRREEFGGPRHRDGVLVPARAGRLRSADAWRTRLASTPHPGGTVQHWAGLAGPLPDTDPSSAPAGTVARDVRGAVQRTGRPAHDGA